MTVIPPQKNDDLLPQDVPTASPLTAFAAAAALDPVSPLPLADPVSLSRSSSIDDLKESLSLLLPIPQHFASKPQPPLKLADLIQDPDGSEPLSELLATVDVSIPANASFVELPSGPAARELKRRWDSRIGVGKDVRSPYAITAFVNQHGKQMYRVGRRELSAPAANSAEIEERVSQSAGVSPTESPKGTRRSRMSMNAFLFKGPMSAGVVPSSRNQAHGAALHPPISRKLRRARSNSDMFGKDLASSQNSAGVLVTGRAYSKSVTGADIAPFVTVASPAKPPAHDCFSEVMDWLVLPQTPTSSLSTHSLVSSPHDSNEALEVSRFYARNAHPFGSGVTFNVPRRRTTANDGLLFLPSPRHLREMQSFESGMTARQSDRSLPTPREQSIFESDPSTPDVERPPSAFRIKLFPAPPAEETATSPTSTGPAQHLPPPIPSPETAAFSHYSTEVFDVLQTYRGLPLLDKLGLESEPTTVKMSLSADESAAPRDDPRFVIWGELHPERDADDRSVSHESMTDLSVHSSSISLPKRRTSKAKPPESSGTRTPAEESPRVLLAATIERWIAQLTSDLNYDELLDFFLTYRTYIDSVELCRLLISRFHWALQQPSSPHDEKVRRIVRVRTFVAIRYWLLTFFTVDFLPKRELRLLMTNWLNALLRDPMLKKHTDGLGIVRKLIKVAKECRQAHIPCTVKPQSRSLSSERAKAVPLKPHVLGEQFAAATRKSVDEEEDSDLDLDFLPEEAGLHEGVANFSHDPANAHLAAAHAGAAGLPSPRPSSSIPFSSLSILQRTDHAPGPGTEQEVVSTFVQNAPIHLPIHHNAISRAFVKTIGRLGRWKRVLHSRTTTRTSLGACANVSAFDLELNMSGDLLAVNGRVEQYLKMTDGSSGAAPTLPPLPTVEVMSEDLSTVLALPPGDPPVLENSAAAKGSGVPPEAVPPEATLPVAGVPPVAPPTVEPGAVIPTLKPLPVDPEDAAVSIRSSSTESFGQPIGRGSNHAPTFAHLGESQWKFDIASIDDLDLSDTSSDRHVVSAAAAAATPSQPGLRRPRKLPLRREFEFVRRPESVSSMGIISHRDSAPSNTSSMASSTSVGGLGPGVARWQLAALVDSLSDDEEKGDAEDALKRLEGQINVQKQQEKASKVDGWIRSIRERMVAGDYNDDESMFSDDEEDELDEPDEPDMQEDCDVDGGGRLDGRTLGLEEIDDSESEHRFAVSSPSLVAAPPGKAHVDGQLAEDETNMLSTPIPPYVAYAPPPSASDLLSYHDGNGRSQPEPAIPPEILQSRLSSQLNTVDVPLRPAVSRFATNTSQDVRRAHLSFILNYRSSTLAEHFAMIDRELFMGVKFEELVLDDWMACTEVNVLDWAQFLKDRARWKAESRFPDKTNALAAVRGRFNLMANFTISEIVLTPPNERPVLVAKFIRIAWKSYLMSNFGTLVAIIAALGSEWVIKAMRRPGWSRVGIWENRMLKDLKMFASHSDDFKYIRQVVASIVDVKPLDMSASVTSITSGSGTDGQSGRGKGSAERPPVPSACIPFIGIYLSQLQRHSRLPDLVDPTAPDVPVGIHPDGSNFDAPAHPEVFSALAPLLDPMNLEPLINVHKQRRIAGVIKSLVAGQHLASRVHFDLDKKLFQKCLRLRGLSPDMLQRASELHG